MFTVKRQYLILAPHLKPSNYNVFPVEPSQKSKVFRILSSNVQLQPWCFGTNPTSKFLLYFPNRVSHLSKMTTSSPFPSHLLSTSTHLQASAKMALRAHSPLLQGFKGSSQYVKVQNCSLSFKPFGAFQNTRSHIICAINMSAGQADDPWKIKLDHVVDKARKFWDSSPQPVKSFPWNRALENFVQLILDLTLAVVKYLCVPLLVVSSLSEMSYCAHERKLVFVPIPLLIGIAVAGILKETALDLSPLLKDAEVPWHLIAMSIFFTLLKLPGPYYPYWGRLFIPHFANGGLWRTLWFAFLWYRRPQKESRMTLQQNSVNGSQSESNKL